MNHINNPGRTGFKGLLIGGLVAGALGLALSEQPYTNPEATKRGESPSTTDTGMMGTGQTPSSQGTGGSSMDQAGSAQLPPNVTPGWKIRVCSEKTKADNINFMISPAEKGSKASGKSSSTTGSMSDKTQTSEGQAGTGSEPTAQSGETGSMGQTAMWSRGEPTVIPVPSDLREADRIKIEATPGQKDQKASVCLLYNDHVAKKLNFDDREVSTVRKTESGECGC
jgi:hypothetical protein